LSFVVVEKHLPDMARLSIGSREFAVELTATNFAFLYDCSDLVPAATFLLDDFKVTGDTALLTAADEVKVWESIPPTEVCFPPTPEP
jgi:hypothetical protein